MSNKQLQPTEAMLEAGVNELLNNIHGLEDDVDDEQLQDAVCFIWQAMHAAAGQS